MKPMKASRKTKSGDLYWQTGSSENQRKSSQIIKDMFMFPYIVIISLWASEHPLILLVGLPLHLAFVLSLNEIIELCDKK